MISTLLDGTFSNHIRHDFDDPMSGLFGLKWRSFSAVEYLNLSSFITQNSIEAVTCSNVRQLIEEHVGGFWKNDGTSTQKYPKNLIKECLRELLGSVTNLHIYIDSCEALLYSFEFVRQLKDEDPNLHIEVSFNEEVKHPLYQSAVILAFECSRNYVLVFAKLDEFLEHMNNCTSLEDIQAKVELSVTSAYAVNCGQDVKWHRNLSFVYVAAFQDSVINQFEARLLAASLKDINFISKKLEQVNFDEPPQCHTNDAVICFKFDRHPDSFYRILPLRSELLDQWIFNEDTSKFTGPLVTLCPNTSNYTIDRYTHLTVRTDVGSVYNLLYDSISILFQWRNS
ncbi:unnamed protein product [Didymodactylos carnosus]|nr:unnamed protein product [Didymodactylos carnosus]CAF4477876.1 unnamed protein product [Didymodactylos carnosus]